MMRRLLVSLVGAALLAGGCASASASAVRPVEARRAALEHPAVAPWVVLHSAPVVLEGMSPRQAKAFRRYQPGLTVDLVREGLVVRLESRFGAEPRRVEVLVDRATGGVLSVQER